MRDLPDRLIALSGLLAERSVRRLILNHAGSSREVFARATDLPRELDGLVRNGGSIEAPELGAVIRFSAGDVRCECADPALSIAILKALAG